MIDAPGIIKKLKAAGDRQQALILQRFFKTGPGDYGEGDVFVGLRVPQVRAFAREYATLSLPEILILLQSPLHEARLLALLLLIQAFRQGAPSLQREIYDLYLSHTRYINNWDLVDLSAEHIVGVYLKERSRKPLRALAVSDLLWDRRIAVLATFHFIKCGDYGETLKLAGRLLGDREDLMHKAVGWMLREIGKRDQAAEEAFLKEHYRAMPRTMLRYAIEKFPEELRLTYLKGNL